MDDTVFAMVSEGELYLRACEQSAKYCVKHASSFDVDEARPPVPLNYYRVDDGLWQDRNSFFSYRSVVRSVRSERARRAIGPS
jgi:DNA transformation protein